MVGCIWQKPVPTYASTVYSVGVGEFGEQFIMHLADAYIVGQ